MNARINRLRPLRARLSLLAAGLFVMLTQACGAQAAPGLGHRVIQPPARGVYTGVNGGPRSNEGSCGGVGRAVGRTMQLCVSYYSIQTLPRILTDRRTSAMAAAGTIPLASLGCRGNGRPGVPSDVTYSQIAAGGEDEYLQRDAEALKTYAARFPKNPLIMIRPFHEFNVNIGNPRGNPNGNNCFSMPESLSQMQAELVAAYRHVVTYFASQGVTNVTWVWCPAFGPGIWERFGGAERIRGFYPGDSYVDWTCGDAYDKSPTGGGIQNAFQNIGFFAQFHKPFIIGETGECNTESPRSPKCSRYAKTQESFINDLAAALQPGGSLSHAGVKAWIYFDQSVARSGYNWSFDAAGIRAFRGLVNSPYFYPPMPPPKWQN